ncbi:MAG TPA: DUF58 domain-containing protein [Longimicrobiales bacterium]|nr:DUF58 domain-containing protein [Longimicrobiales bacterium]
MTNPPHDRGAPRPDLLAPRELRGLGGLEYVARTVVEGFLTGLHRSPHRGFSVEFAEHRAYQPGDDLRYMDWRMVARTDRYFVKQFEEETNLRAFLLLDASASMGWSSDPEAIPTKLWYAKQLAAALAFLLLRQGDAVGALSFDEAVRDRVAARGGRKHWLEIGRLLERARGTGETGAGTALRDAAQMLRRRGLVILLSDLLVDAEETRLALRYLRHRGHEVLVFHLLDPGERELPGVGDARFYDPETGEELPVTIADLRSEYRESVAGAIADWRRSLAPHGIDYVLLDTSLPFVHGLREYMRKRQRLA